jgi:hypothetical protein
MRTLTTSRKYKRVFLFVAVVIILLVIAYPFLRSNVEFDHRIDHSTAPSEAHEVISPGPLKPNRKAPSLVAHRPTPSTIPPTTATKLTPGPTRDESESPTMKAVESAPDITIVSSVIEPEGGDSTRVSSTDDGAGDVQARLRLSGRYNASTTVLHVVSHHHWDRCVFFFYFLSLFVL